MLCISFPPRTRARRRAKCRYHGVVSERTEFCSKHATAANHRLPTLIQGLYGNRLPIPSESKQQLQILRYHLRDTIRRYGSDEQRQNGLCDSLTHQRYDPLSPIAQAQDPRYLPESTPPICQSWLDLRTHAR